MVYCYDAVCVVSTIVTWRIIFAARRHLNIAAAAAVLSTGTIITAPTDDSDDDDDDVTTDSALNLQLT